MKYFVVGTSDLGSPRSEITHTHMRLHTNLRLIYLFARGRNYNHD